MPPIFRVVCASAGFRGDLRFNAATINTNTGTTWLGNNIGVNISSLVAEAN